MAQIQREETWKRPAPAAPRRQDARQQDPNPMPCQWLSARADRCSCVCVCWCRDGSCATTAGTRRRSSPAWRATSAATASPTTPAGWHPPSSRSHHHIIVVGIGCSQPRYPVPPSSYAIITSSACAFTHRSVPVHDELHNFVPCRYVRTLLLEIGRFIRLGTYYLYHNKTRVTIVIPDPDIYETIFRMLGRVLFSWSVYNIYLLAQIYSLSLCDPDIFQGTSSEGRMDISLSS